MSVSLTSQQAGPVPFDCARIADSPSTPSTPIGPCAPDEHAAASPFARLLGASAWLRLRPEVRRRFSHSAAHAQTTLYAGRVTETRLSLAGRILALACGLIGTPLPRGNGVTGPASVSVNASPAMRGQIWTRIYLQPGGFPQVVHSVKRFAGPTGLEEFVGPGAGWGFGMALCLSEKRGALVFESERYFFECLGRRVWLPRALEPGRMRITHRQIEGARFQFLLELTHPVFGALIRQDATFSETAIRNPLDGQPGSCKREPVQA